MSTRTSANACWVVTNGGFYLTGNNGSNELGEYTISSNATVSLMNPIAAGGIPVVIDMASRVGPLRSDPERVVDVIMEVINSIT
jgi:hypothetical protein